MGELALNGSLRPPGVMALVAAARSAGAAEAVVEEAKTGKETSVTHEVSRQSGKRRFSFFGLVQATEPSDGQARPSGRNGR